MKIFRQLKQVRAAQARVAAHRSEIATPAAALLTRGQQHPLTALGVATGAGFVLGSLNMQPLRVPGFGALLRGGLAEVVAQVTRLVVELGAADSDAA